MGIKNHIICHTRRNCYGFTIIELLVVVIILGALTSIAVPIFSNKSMFAKQVIHNQNVGILHMQGNAYLMGQKEIPNEDKELIGELETYGYIKEIPTNPLTGVKDYSVMYYATTRKIEVTPGKEEIIDNGGDKGEDDEILGTIPDVPTFSANPSAVTNGSVTVDITYSEDTNIKEYKVGADGVWTIYITGVIMMENDTIYARGTNLAGNTSIDASLSISNIDKIIPTATVNYSTILATNQNVIATITTSKEVTVTNNGGLKTYTFTENGSFTFDFVDVAGNIGSVTATVSNIDKVAPVSPTFIATPTTATNGNVTLTIIYSADSSVKEYKIGNEGTWTNYTTALIITSNNTIYARGTDEVGNVSTESGISITNIDTTAPIAPTANVISGIYNTSKSVTLSGETGATIRYTTNGVNPTTSSTIYSSAIAINTTTTLKAIQWDAAGNASPVATYTYTIDTIAPTVAITANVPDTTAVSLITYTIKFSENVTGFDTTDITITNGTKGTFTVVDGSTYTVVVTNSGPCIQTVTVDANKCIDIAGNGNTAGSKTITIGLTGSSVTVGKYIKLGSYKINPASTTEVGEDIIWRVVKKEDKNGDGTHELLLISDKIISLKAFDASGLNTGYGDNRWGYSNIRDWLNSNATAGNVAWTHAGPTQSWNGWNNYATKAGFLNNLTTQEQSKIVPVTLSTPTSTPSVTYNEKVFLIAEGELPLLTAGGYSDYRAQVTAKAVAESNYTSNPYAGQYWIYWTRTPWTSFPHQTRTINASGTTYDYSAYHGHFGIRPMLYLNPVGIIVEGTGTLNTSPYIIKWN